MNESSIAPWVRELLRCPACLSELSDETSDNGPELVCTNGDCALAYPVEDGIPVLLIDQGRPPA